MEADRHKPEAKTIGGGTLRPLVSTSMRQIVFAGLETLDKSQNLRGKAMMYVVEAFSISKNAKTDAVIFETVEEAIEFAEEIERKDLHVFVTKTTGEPDDEGEVIYDI